MSDNIDSASLQINLLEFERLRQEIDNRSTISSNYMLALITATGAGVGFVATAPDILLGLCYGSTILWLLWMDQTEQIFKAAAYIGTQLAPKYNGKIEKAFYWEKFLREIDKNDAKSAKLLSPIKSAESEIYIRPTTHIFTFAALFFGGLSITSLFLYFFTVVKDPILNFINYLFHLTPDQTYIPNSVSSSRSIGFFLALLFLIYGTYNFLLFRKSLKSIDKVICDFSDSSEDSNTGTNKIEPKQTQTKLIKELSVSENENTGNFQPAASKKTKDPIKPKSK